MKTITRFLCFVILISIPAALLAAPKYDYGSRDSYYDRPTDRNGVTISGSVRTTDKHGRTIQLTIGSRTEKCRLADGFRVYSGSRTIDIDDLRKGDYVRIEGYREKSNQFIALTIYAGANDSRRYDDRRYEASIRARVVRDTSVFNRTLRVTALDGGNYNDTFDLDVAKDARVTRRGRSISVHEIRSGDIVDASGYWQGSDFIARVVEVSEGYSPWQGDNRGRDYRTIEGVVQDGIDYRTMKFTLDNGPDKFKVYAESARVVRNGNTVDFREVRRDQVVTISGRLDGHTLYADHVDISGYTDRRY